jgi:hypothetical protein
MCIEHLTYGKNNFSISGIFCLGKLISLLHRQADRTYIACTALRARVRDIHIINHTNKKRKTSFLNRRTTFLSERMTFLSKRMTFLSRRTTFLSERMTFLSKRMTFLSRRMTFLSERMTFLNRRRSFLSRNYINLFQIWQ